MSNSLRDINLAQLTTAAFTPSPSAWEDQVLYFLLVDRFSNGKEQGLSPAGATPLFQPADSGNAVTNDTDAATWRNAGGTWANGNIKGMAEKLPYLQQLGITTVWVSPVFKQVAFQDTYHGYGIQDFLEVDSHFGTKEDMQAFVKQAHALGIYVILDIILNHTGNVFSYDADRYITTANGNTFIQPRWDDNPYRVKGFNDARGRADNIAFTAGAAAGPDDAIWPLEFRDPGCFTQKGQIINWDYEPEFLQGDFFDLKDIHLGDGTTNNFSPSPALLHLAEVYKYWIALLDIDGYRVDTVKHMETGAVRFFASAIHEFAMKNGKDNFYLIGEITGDRSFAFNKLEETGIDAALGIADVQQMLCNMIKGKTNPADFFDLFRNSILVGKESHTWFRNKVVVMLDDHDKVVQGNDKARFCAHDDGDKLIRNALAANLTVLGIPCIYYGSEQGFDGQGSGDGADRYIREAMFGGAFGAFRSREKHFFDAGGALYKEVSDIISLRKKHITLRRGRQYLREISGDGIHFGLPSFVGNASKINSVIAWSRIMDNDEMIVAMNTDTENDQSVWVTIDAAFHATGSVFTAIYPSGNIIPDTVVEQRNGKALFITVPKAGFIIYKKS